MSDIVNVRFRGGNIDVVIDKDHGYEGDTNCHVIDWHFDGITPEEHEAMALTDEEEQDIYEQLQRWSWERTWE